VNDSDWSVWAGKLILFLGRSQLTKQLKRFKRSKTINVLLLPVQIASQGLNIIEGIFGGNDSDWSILAGNHIFLCSY